MKPEFKEAYEATRQLLHTHPGVQRYRLVGSAVYCEDAKDVDILVLTQPEHTEFIGSTDAPNPARWMFGSEWELCVGEYDDMDDKWGAIRKGPVNLIVTVDPDWFDRACTASDVCVALNLTRKRDRLLVWRIVRDGMNPLSAEVSVKEWEAKHGT